MRTALLLVLLAAACHKDSPAPGNPASTGDADALWKMAPDGAVIGVVVSPRAMQLAEHGYVDVIKFVDSIPEAAPTMAKLKAELKTNLGTDALTFDAAGMSDTKGGIAVFMRGDKRGVAILPVTDRDKFLKVMHGTKGEPLDTIDKETMCMTTHGVYACATDKGMFDAIGKGSLDAKAAGARGDIEFVLKDFDMRAAKKLNVSVVGQLERGQVTFRGTANVGALPLQFPAPSKPRTAGAGFGMAYVKPWLALIPMPNDNKPLFGVTVHDLVASIDDPVTVTMSTTSLDAQVPLNNPTPFKTVIDHCGDLPAQLQAKLVDGACHMPLPNYPGVSVDVWIDGKTLHVGQKQATPGTSVEMSGLEKELASSEWHYAFAGRGSILAATPEIWTQFQTMQQMLPGDMTGVLDSAIRGMVMLNEVGLGVKLDGENVKFVLGVRTAWSNPDDVVAKLTALDPATISSGKGADVVKSLPASSPLANDIKAGYVGAMVPAAMVGVLAAVSIPAFIEYTRRAKKTEVSLNLNRLGKNLKVFFITNAQFPIGDAPLTPSAKCCGQPDNKCPVDSKQWESSEMWKQLDFEIFEPSRYQYTYHSDGKTVDVTAVGDLDCDGQMATYKLTASQDQGNPSFVIDGPPPGVQ